MHHYLPNSNVFAVGTGDLNRNATLIPHNDLNIEDSDSRCSDVQSAQSCSPHGCQNTVDLAIDSSSASDLLHKSSALTTLLKSRGSSNISEDPEQHHSIPRKDRYYHDTPGKTLYVLNSWRWEIASLSVAIGMLGAMYGILRRYDDQRVPDWGPNINLNTLLATMATAIRICLIFVVAEIIGQAKWNYFASNPRSTRDRPTRQLVKADHFDQASKGFIGALRLIPSIITDTTTLLAILVVVFSSGIGTLVQQAIHTRICQFPFKGTNSSLPISRNLKSGTMVDGKYTPNVPSLHYLSLQAAMTSALALDSEEIGSLVSVDCSTGNCTFSNSIDGIYSTLGICSYCGDTTSLISSNNWTKSGWESNFGKPYTAWGTNYSLPNGMKITSKTQHFDDRDYHNWELLVRTEYDLLGNEDVIGLIGPEMRALSHWSIHNVNILASNRRPSGDTEHDDLAAVTCTIYSCLRSYRALVTNGKLMRSLVGTIPVAPNVIAGIPPNATIQDIYHEIDTIGVYALVSKHYQISPYLNYQAVQSPCLVGDTIWTTDNMSSAANGERILLLHATVNETHPFTVQYTTVPIECLYSFESPVKALFATIIDLNILNGLCSTLWGTFQDMPDYTQFSCGDSFWLAKFYSDTGTTATSIMKRINDFTDRVSDKLQMGLISEPDKVYGQTLETTVCTAVNSKWLLFPTILVAATNGLLAWSLLRSWRDQNHAMLWKSSILPFLFYSERFEPQNCEDMSGDTTISRCTEEESLLTLREIEFEARHRIVQFRGTSRQEAA